MKKSMIKQSTGFLLLSFSILLMAGCPAFSTCKSDFEACKNYTNEVTTRHVNVIRNAVKGMESCSNAISMECSADQQKEAKENFTTCKKTFCESLESLE